MKRDKILFLSLIIGLSTLAVTLYSFELNLSEPLSSLFLFHPPFTALFNEYTPLAITIIILIWIKMGKLKRDDSLNPMMSTFILVGVVLVFLIFFRVWDTVAMIVNPHEIHNIFFESHAKTWMRIFFFCGLSLILMGFFTIFYGLKGFKTMFITSIIPAFYSFNTDIVVYADRIKSFSVFYPIFQFILEYGKFETLVISGIFNIFNISNWVNVTTFPYQLVVGGTFYIVDLACLGWEGVVGYSIIFLIFISELVTDNKMKIVWAILGFFGTLLVNFIRLILIFFAGIMWGSSVADLIHQNVGDVIFLVWMLVFLYIVGRFSKRHSLSSISQEDQPALI